MWWKILELVKIYMKIYSMKNCTQKIFFLFFFQQNMPISHLIFNISSLKLTTKTKIRSHKTPHYTIWVVSSYTRKGKSTLILEKIMQSHSIWTYCLLNIPLSIQFFCLLILQNFCMFSFHSFYQIFYKGKDICDMQLLTCSCFLIPYMSFHYSGKLKPYAKKKTFK